MKKSNAAVNDNSTGRVIEVSLSLKDRTCTQSVAIIAQEDDTDLVLISQTYLLSLINGMIFMSFRDVKKALITAIEKCSDEKSLQNLIISEYKTQEMMSQFISYRDTCNQFKVDPDISAIVNHPKSDWFDDIVAEHHAANPITGIDNE
jgi:dihydroxyacetone kinase-like predicted kinase